MKLFVMDNCDECDDVRKVVEEKNISLDIVKVQKLDGKYYQEMEDGTGMANVDIDATPTLYIERTKEEGVLLSGKEGIIDILTKGYLHKVKLCPHLAVPCKEKDCELFSIIMNNNIPEGKCSEAWSPVFMLDFITGMNNYIAKLDKLANKKEE